MPDDKGAEAAAARAARLREQIDGLEIASAKAAPATREDTAERQGATPALSPREFVQKRMRELDSKI